MDPISAVINIGMPLVMKVIEMIQEARAAKAEEHAAIVARMQAAAASLAGDRAGAHAALDAFEAELAKMKGTP